MKLLTALLGCMILLASCDGPGLSEKTLQTDAATLAQLQCEAKKLQEERFKLATDIRLLEDSVMTGQDSTLVAGYKTKLAQLEPLKEDVWLRTKAMADSINHVLTQLHEGTYKDTADRKLLDGALATEFARICP